MSFFDDLFGEIGSLFGQPKKKDERPSPEVAQSFFNSAPFINKAAGVKVAPPIQKPAPVSSPAPQEPQHKSFFDTVLSAATPAIGAANPFVGSALNFSRTNPKEAQAIAKGVTNTAVNLIAPPIVGAGEVFNRDINAPIQATLQSAGQFISGKPVTYGANYNKAADTLTGALSSVPAMFDRLAGTNTQEAINSSYEHPLNTAALTALTALGPTIKAAGTLGKLAETAIGGGFGLQAASQLPAQVQNIQNSKGDERTQAITETILNAGVAGLGLVGAAHGGFEVTKAGVAGYKANPVLNGEGGYIKFPGGEGLTPDQYRAKIKQGIQSEIDFFNENPAQFDTRGATPDNRAVIKDKKALFKEFTKNPDAFIDKYKLLPPDKVEAPATPKKIVTPKEAAVKALSEPQVITPPVEEPVKVKPATEPVTVKRGSLEYVASGIQDALNTGLDLPSPTETKLNPVQKIRAWLTGKKFSETNFKVTGDEINKTFDSMRREQQVIGRQVGDAIREIVPDQTSREAITAIKETGGDVGKLRDYAANEDLPENLRSVAQKAVDLLESGDSATKKALLTLHDFYEKTGATFKDADLIKQLKGDYSNRLYDGGPEVASSKDPNLSGGTRHTKQQVYPDPFKAALDGKSPVLDAAELAHRYSEDIARAVPNKIIIDTMKENKLGDYYAPGQIPKDWVAVPGTEKNIPYLDADGKAQVNSRVFAVPQELAAAIKPLVSPDYFNKIESLGKLQQVNALSKFGKLGFSLFHWYAEGKELLGQTRGGIDIPKFLDLLKNEDINKMERFVAKYGITTDTSPDAQINILSDIKKSGGALGKVVDLPGVSHVLELAQKNNEALFQKFIPAIKTVNGFQRMMRWVDAHPEATEAQTTKAFREIGRETNASHGGNNWVSLGKDPSANSIARFSLLAYDWTYSNWDKAKLAVTPDIRNAGANAARVSVVSSVVVGYTLTRLLNQAINNGETDPGHENEVKIGSTYVSMYPAVVNDALSLYSKTAERGIIGGPAEFLSGKLSPVGQAVVGLLSNTNQFGAPITTSKNSQFENAVSALGFAGEKVSPLPISGNAAINAINSPGANIGSVALAASGLGKTPATRKSKGGSIRKGRIKKVRIGRVRVGKTHKVAARTRAIKAITRRA